jgi:hypothetical protein
VSVPVNLTRSLPGVLESVCPSECSSELESVCPSEFQKVSVLVNAQKVSALVNALVNWKVSVPVNYHW